MRARDFGDGCDEGSLPVFRAGVLRQGGVDDGAQGRGEFWGKFFVQFDREICGCGGPVDLEF